MAGITLPSWLSFLSGPLGWVIGLIVGQLVKFGDWGIYMVARGALSSAQGADFQKAGEELAALPKDAPKEKREELKKKKSQAFDRLMGAEP